MSLRNTMLAGGLVVLSGCDDALNTHSTELNNQTEQINAQTTKVNAQTEQINAETERTNAKTKELGTQAKAITMLKAEGIEASPSENVVTDSQVVLLNTNEFIPQGSYYPIEYKSSEKGYEGTMVLIADGITHMANYEEKNCLIIDGDSKTNPIATHCSI